METEFYRPKHTIRFVTAASLFDGHDASINIMRRLLQAAGAEVVHLGHNRSVHEIVDAALQEDVQGIAISSYQGGHVEYFKYLIDLLAENGASHIKVFGGGGGTIVPREIEELERYGVQRIYSPEDGRELGLYGIINDILRRSDFSTLEVPSKTSQEGARASAMNLARLISSAELNGQRSAKEADSARQRLRSQGDANRRAVAIGITGTGGAGKSSLTDELLLRYRLDFPDEQIVVLCVDPTKKKTGGALLGDRIRMNAVDSPRIFMRSLATRSSQSEVSDSLDESILAAKAMGASLIIVETSGIGQGDAAIVSKVQATLYVMTPEFGAPSQLEKIDMIDFADAIAINKFDRGAGEDALRDVRKQYRRSRRIAESVSADALPVFGTIASQFNDEGVNALYLHLLSVISDKRGEEAKSQVSHPGRNWSIPRQRVISPRRVGYLGEIVENNRRHQQWVDDQVAVVGDIEALERAIELIDDDAARNALESSRAETTKRLDPDARQSLQRWHEERDRRAGDEMTFDVRGKVIKTPLRTKSLAGSSISRVSLPRFRSRADTLSWLYRENLPGSFPYTAGVFPFKRADEDPARQFAGEGSPDRTNARFHLLCDGARAKRLSTAFDSVTLYGCDPAERPDIWGKIGESGVSICTLDDMQKLFAGFDLVDPNTSVSMTINGPAPIILAMFFNTAILQNVTKFEKENGRAPDAEERRRIAVHVLNVVRGTVQADILKEDQAQNTCIFSTEFALRMMGDVQEYFIRNQVRNYYSVSISGYHIAEAGANPITQLAFTLANGFTYVEYYLSRGMKIDDFAPNFSFFFSNGLDPEYAVLGRVARRIWARAVKYKYGGNDRSQKLKYHIQTSGRSLHAQEVDFNDIRTTLQALLAIYDNCNSLHTNAYDEAITTPTEESVRRALAIQLIINREFGMAKNENPLQGSFIVDELTDLVEAAVLEEFEALNRRGGVIAAMESQYQRSKIQEESMLYERLKHSGELPIVGVNTFLRDGASAGLPDLELTRSGAAEKNAQIANLRAFQSRAGSQTSPALAQLQRTALAGGNIFEELMETVKVASLGQISQALYEVGGKYRRNM